MYASLTFMANLEIGGQTTTAAACGQPQAGVGTVGSATKRDLEADHTAGRAGRGRGHPPVAPVAPQVPEAVHAAGRRAQPVPGVAAARRRHRRAPPPRRWCATRTTGFSSVSQARELGIELEGVVVEPDGRSTAPALTLAALRLSESWARAADHTPMLSMHADHVVSDIDAFRQAVSTARGLAADGRVIVALEVAPH